MIKPGFMACPASPVWFLNRKKLHLLMQMHGVEFAGAGIIN